MLLLSRKEGEIVNIDEDVIVEVRRIAGNRVTLAIIAPKDVRIDRGEVHDRREQERLLEIT